jgi:methyl-accepting chemotaxis protein
MISQIRVACDEQSRGSDQISLEVEDIQTSTTVNLNATRVMNESVASLFRQIEALKTEISNFKV